MHLTNLGFTARFMSPAYMNLCASQTLKGAICRLKYTQNLPPAAFITYFDTKKDGTRKSCCPSLV